MMRQIAETIAGLCQVAVLSLVLLTGYGFFAKERELTALRDNCERDNSTELCPCIYDTANADLTGFDYAPTKMMIQGWDAVTERQQTIRDITLVCLEKSENSLWNRAYRNNE
jgi:hypothetical protein